MSPIILDRARGLDGQRGRSAAGARIFEPKRAVVGTAIAWGAQVDADAADRALDSLCAEEGPHLRLRHRHKSDRTLILILARAGARVIGHREYAAGDDEVVGATGAKAAEI